MALIDCGECGKQISSLAAACPGCGWPPPASAAAPLSAPSTKTNGLKETPVVAPVSVTLVSPDSLGQAVVSTARQAGKSKVWGKLFQTTMVLAKVWGVLMAIGAFWALFFDGSSPTYDRWFAAAMLSAMGGVPVVALWGLGEWFAWLKQEESPLSTDIAHLEHQRLQREFEERQRQQRQQQK